MQPITYTLNLQRILIAGLALSFLGICAMLTMGDPYKDTWLVWALLGCVGVFLTGCWSFIAFWWSFFIRKKVLTIVQVNQVVYRSFTWSCVCVYLLSLWHTSSLNQLGLIIAILALIAYSLALQES